MNDDSNDNSSDYDFVTAYTDAERETFRRCQNGKPVSDSNLLMLVSTDLLRMQEQLDNAFDDARLLENPAFWSNMNELSIRLTFLSGYCEQWRAKKTGEPERQAVEWRPSPDAAELRAAMTNPTHNSDPKRITGQLKGPWVVMADNCERCGSIKVTLVGGERALSGVSVGEVARAGEDWRSLVVEVVGEKRRRTGRQVSTDCAEVWVSELADAEVAILSRELSDILCRLTTKAPPRLIH
jgi:hypothetical protein